MVDLTSVFQDLLTKFISGVPSVFMALLVFLVGLFVAKVISKMIERLLKSIKIDELGDKLNEVDIVNKANVEIKLSKVFAKVFYYVLVLFFAIAATEILGLPVLSELVMDVFNMIPNLIVAGIILVVGILLADAIRKVVKTACESLGIPSAKLISLLLFYFILINVIVSAMTQAKIETEFFSQNITMVIGGAVFAFAIGYGLASKQTVGNFIASGYVSNRVKIGDSINVQGHKGTVVDMDKSSVTLDTGSSKVHVPLHMIGNGVIEVN